MKKRMAASKPQRREKGSGGVVSRGNRFYARIRTAEGERFSAPCNSREEAETALRRMNAGEVDPRQTPLFKDYYGALLRDPEDEPGEGEGTLPDIYYTDARGRLARRYDRETWKLHETVLRLWIADSPVGKAKVGELKTKTIQALIDVARQQGRAWGTVRRYGSCIRTALEEARTDELIAKNPADELKYGQKTRKKAYVLSKRQSVNLPEALYEFSPRLSAMIVIELDAGLRPGEVCGIRAEDLDMPEDGVWAVWIRRSIGRDGSAKKVKDGEERLVYLTDDALEAIALNLDGRCKGYVFQTDVGKPLTPDYLGTQLRRFRANLQRRLETEARASNSPVPAIPPLTHRGFRRTFATRGVRSGDLKGTQHLLGHATPEMTTGIYAEPEDGAMRKTVEAIQASVGYRGLFKGGSP